MRTKLTEIISTMDQFNGMGKYSDEYKDGEIVDIDTEVPDADTQEKEIKEMLQVKQGVKRLDEHVNYLNSRVLPFNQFLKEYNGPVSSNIQSYFGSLDDKSDDEEEIWDDEE